MHEDAFRVYCNNLAPRRSALREPNRAITLNCYPTSRFEQNVRLRMSEFVGREFQIPKRFADLLEIASYIYCADRKASRGHTESLYLDSWRRSFEFNIAVRDLEFWKRRDVQLALSECLQFLTGDLEYTFKFRGEFTPTGQIGLFQSDTFVLTADYDYRVLLFSGGLDSLAGAIHELQAPERNLILTSHVSGRPTMRSVQDNLYRRLHQVKGVTGRVNRYRFDCGLSRDPRVEETQRTRSFLFCAIAFVIAKHYARNEMYIYENGITSLNWTVDKSMGHARASRTTHPQAIRRIQNFLSLMSNTPFQIHTDFFWKTKGDVYSLIVNHGLGDLIRHTVSCSRGITEGMHSVTHCGHCSQCVERRFAAYSCQTALAHDFDDAGLYQTDFIQNEIPSEPQGVSAALYDFIRLAKSFYEKSPEGLLADRMPEFALLSGYLPGVDEEDEILQIHGLCNRHGKQVMDAMNRMRTTHDYPFGHVAPGSLLDSIAKKSYL